jgi:hypothetical protein
MIPVETVPGIGGGGMKDSSGGGEFKIWYIWYIVKTFVNTTVYPTQYNNKGKKQKFSNQSIIIK